LFVWEKAFYKVDQHMLFNALYRLILPDYILKLIESFYVTP